MNAKKIYQIFHIEKSWLLHEAIYFIYRIRPKISANSLHMNISKHYSFFILVLISIDIHESEWASNQFVVSVCPVEQRVEVWKQSISNLSHISHRPKRRITP